MITIFMNQGPKHKKLEFHPLIQMMSIAIILELDPQANPNFH